MCAASSKGSLVYGEFVQVDALDLGIPCAIHLFNHTGPRVRLPFMRRKQRDHFQILRSTNANLIAVLEHRVTQSAGVHSSCMMAHPKHDVMSPLERMMGMG